MRLPLESRYLGRVSETQTPHTPQSWSAASQRYANVAAQMMEAFGPTIVERLGANSEHKALEVASGTGALTVALAPKVKSLLATDFAPGMLEVLRARMQALGTQNIEFELMNGQALDLTDASFDRAACCFGLMLFPDRGKGFSELRRVLRPGGRAAVTGWATPDRFEAFALFLGAMKRAFPDLPPPSTPPAVFSLADPSTFKKEMEAAGFRDVEVEFVSQELELESADALWTIFSSGAPPVKILLERVGAEGEAKLREALRSNVQERFGEGPIRFTNVATLGVGVAP